MAGSVLLKLARDSMLEVYQAQHIIDKEELLAQHPILATPMNCKVSIFLDEKQRASYTTDSTASLLENIILAAKKAAFEDPNTTPLTTSEFLHAQVELSIFSDEGVISERDEPILNAQSTPLV